jgi:hypothetical protein
VSGLRETVRAGLARHGIVPGPEETPAALRERLNDLYLEDVRRLKARQRSAAIPLQDYAAAVHALKEGYPLLSLPLKLWVE